MAAAEQAASSSRLPPDISYSTPTPAVIDTILAAEPSAKASSTRPAAVLRHSLRWAVTHADVELVSYLAALEGRWADILDEEVAMLEDDEGWGVVGMAIQSSCGQSEKEEAVRLVVARWGVYAGPRCGRDRAGWTPLHLAALLSSPQTVSVLLNRGASSLVQNDAGMTPFDIITDMEGRESLALLLDPSNMSQPPTPATPGNGSFRQQQQQLHEGNQVSADRRRRLQRRRARIAAGVDRAVRRDERARIAAERERWVRDRAKSIGVDASVLFSPPKPAQKAQDEAGDDEEDEDMEGEDEDELDVDEALGGGVFQAKIDMEASMLVFSLNQLPAIFEVLINTYRPVCQPRTRRGVPANALYKYARFAHFRCNAVWLEELLFGAVDAIEGVVYNNNEDLANLAFWEYNLTRLLYLLRTDDELRAACDEMDNILATFEELVNTIHVFIIRIAERKIDAILEPSLLDFEALDDFGSVRFTDEWNMNIFRSFGAKKKREIPLAASMFGMPTTPTKNGRDSPDNRSLRSVKSLGRPTSISDLRAAAASAKADAKEAIANGIASAQAVFSDKPNPDRVADILTDVLLILQLYEVNPAFIVQVFSQVFFWISSELFNRVITRRNYLCRTKAVQIRMNITALENWTRSNGLPPMIASRHFVPIMQLLQWLQCSSQIREFDMLIGTVQSLRSLNPLQMRRAVQNYRYEVDEGRMADDCNQYLHQLVRDWDTRRVHTAVQTIQSQRGDAPSDKPADDSLPIEALFDGSVSLSDWTPQTGPESMGELLDSRYMLPFLMPPTEYLLAMPPPDAAFQNLLTEAPLLPDGSIPSRPLSIASYSSSKPMTWAAVSDRKARELPDDFLTWLKERQHAVLLTHQNLRPQPHRTFSDQPESARTDTASSARSAGLPPPPAPIPLPQPVSTPARPSESPSAQTTPLAILLEDCEVTPSAADRTQPLTSPPMRTVSLETSGGPKLARRASQELAFQSAPVDRSPTSPTAELIELRSHVEPNGSANGHYELARHRRERQASISSINSISSIDKKRWWNKMGARVASSGSDDIPLRQLKERRQVERQDSDQTIVPVRKQSGSPQSPALML